MTSGAQTSGSSFQVLPGGRRVSDAVAGVQIVVARGDDPPFAIDGEVFEEDTWLAMSTELDVIRSPDHPVRVMTLAWEAKPENPGSVTVERGPPARLLAVVHDLDAEPSCTEEWVESALYEVFMSCTKHRLHALKLPLLGSKHGNLPATRFMALLRRSLQRAVDEDGSLPLRRLWLARGSEPGDELLRALADLG